MATAVVTFQLVLVLLWSFVDECRLLTVLTEQQLTVSNPGETAVLDCSFTSTRYNMFDYPVIWRKQQLDEWTQINVMGSVNEPFASGSSGTSRFEVSFTSDAPIYHVELTILDLIREDSGNYTCEIRGPLSVSLGTITHKLFVRDPVVKILLLDENSPTSLDYSNLSQLDHTSTLFSPSAIRTVENHPCRIRCVALGGYPPPSIEVHVGPRVITAEFGFRHVATLRPSPTGINTVSAGSVSSVGPSSGGGVGGVGTRGLRTIDFRSERWSNNFLARAEDDEALMKCISIVPGLKPSVVVAKLHVDFPPKISCIPVSAYIGERDVIITCEVRAKPRMTSLFWIVDNGTTLSDRDKVEGYTSTTRDYADGATVAQLHIRQTRLESFRLYTIVAENSVAIAAKDVQLHQKIKAPPSSYPLSDLSSAIAGHASHRETSREPRGGPKNSFNSDAQRNLKTSMYVCLTAVVVALVVSHWRDAAEHFIMPSLDAHSYRFTCHTPNSKILTVNCCKR